jgi:hypothetical protein
LKTKLLTMFVLVLCMSAFLFPVSAYAAADAEPPVIKVWLDGDMLFIEATDNGSGVEAIFIDGSRVNYRVDGGLALAASDYADEGETISLYAVDFAGNKSETVTVNIPISAVPTAPPTQSNPFTPEGQASVVDRATDSDGKNFYTFTTPEGNVFYLIIDHQRNGENVYFLNAVTENDLLALAESSGSGNSSAIPTPAPVPTPDPEPTPEPEPPAKQSSNGTMTFLLIAVIAVGGAGYYIKIIRPKQQADTDDDDFDEDDDGEDMELPEGRDDDDDYDYPTEEDEPETEDE